MSKYPEGEEFFLWLTRRMAHMDVVDFGCGDGRLARFFDVRHYYGVDKHPANIIQAMRTNDGYRFLCNFSYSMNEQFAGFGYTLFAHDVMPYIPDEGVEAVIETFTQPRVIISEVLGRDRRTSTVFNRELEEYERPMRAAGYRLHRVQFYVTADHRDNAVLEFHKQ